MVKDISMLGYSFDLLAPDIAQSELRSCVEDIAKVVQPSPSAGQIGAAAAQPVVELGKERE
jgi:hypothetical protein